MHIVALAILRKIFSVIVGNLAKALFTEKMIMEFFLMFGDWLVKKTDTSVDNEAWAKLRPALEKKVK